MPTDLIVKLNNTIGSKNALLNKYLNKIADKAEIKKHISMHIARHSFAKIAKDNHIDNNHLKNLLGHSNIKITETYMGSFDTQETDKAMALLFKKKEEPKEQLTQLIEKMTPEEISMLIKQIKS